MKRVCIVLRNKKNGVLTPNFAPVCDALLSGGYFLEEVALIPYDDVNALHAKIRAHLEVADLLCVVADKVLINGVQGNLAQNFSLNFERGVALSGKTLVCVLPAGQEGKKSIEEFITPLMNERLNVRFDRMIFRMVGAPQEVVDNALNRAYAVSGDAITYNFNDDYADQRLELIYDSVTPKMLADQVVRIVLSELEEFVYTLDDTLLEERVYEALKLRKLKLSVCESFTGGGISARMVKVSGVSEVFDEGLNTYSNRSKTQRLAVKEETLQYHGAVSAQTAHEMAEGLFAAGNCDVCVATTGIAGPKSDLTKKPVGLCYIAAGIKNQIFVNEYVFQGDRECITQTAINYALFALFKLLKE